MKISITTVGASLGRHCKTLLEQFSFHGRKASSSHRKGQILIGPRLRWHYRFLYLKTLRQELCNVYHRMEILRSRHLCQTGISLLSISELAHLSRHHQNTLLRNRTSGIQRLRANLPTATLVDLHLAIKLIPAHPFAEDQSMEAQPASRTSRTGI